MTAPGLAGRFHLAPLGADGVPATLTGWRSDGAHVTVMLDEPGVECIRVASDPDVAAQRAIDEALVPHILAIEAPPF